MATTKAREKYLNYLYKQYQKGLIGQDKLEELRREGYIKDDEPKDDPISPELKRRVRELSWDQSMDPFLSYDTTHFKYKQEIRKDDWLPVSVTSHEQDFIDWINSMTYGFFPHRIDYKKFIMYKVQAYRWLLDDDNITSYHTDESRRDFVKREYDRCAENSLYFVDRYGELKEGDISSGYVKYTAREHHAVICYLFDCGYNVIGGKGRQIGFTSIMGLLAVKKLIFQSNYYIKFVTEDKETGIEIFTDKIKYPFGALPRWMRPKVKSDSGTRFWLSDKIRKGEKGYPNSRIDVIAPKNTAINGGSPQLVLIDEIGNIGILGAMLNEGRPTMFWNNPKTGKFELKRQVWMWGTGGKMEKGGGEYEKEWYRILGLWEAKSNHSGFVPLFFSWHCRFDVTEYEKEKSWYYGARAQKEDIDLETSKTQFHQHYPSTFNDMFLKTASTLVSREIIESGIDRCRKVPADLRPVYGYFEPVFDESDPMPPESDVPYRIIGARFVPVSDEDIKKASVIIFQRPEPGWRHRYWKGSDPIATETGHSKFASVIWDDLYKTISALVFYRVQHDHKYTFLQVLLLGLYYGMSSDGSVDIKELVEANIGTNYIDYTETKGYFHTLVFNSQLPTKVAGGTRLIGIDNKGTRADAIIDYMTEVIRAYHDRFYISLIFEQLHTFVQKKTTSGKEVWGVVNKTMHYDDVLYALVYAYICRLSHMHLSPTREVASTTRFKVRYKLVRNAANEVVRVPVKVPIYETVTGASPLNIDIYENTSV